MSEMVKDRTAGAAGMKRWRLEPSPYDLRHPLEAPPARLRRDPRIADQRRTAFWVTVKGEHVGRVTMVEFEDRPGWFYQPEILDPRAEGGSAGIPVASGEPMAKRSDAADFVVKEWTKRKRGTTRAPRPRKGS